MKKSISINLQGLVFHIEEDGYEHLRRYLAEVKAHFATYAGHEEIVADIESRIAELFSARLTATKQIITFEEVVAVTAQLGSVADFDLPEDADEPVAAGQAYRQTTGSPYSAGSATAADQPAEPRQLFRDETNKKIAGVAAGLAHYFNVNPLWIRLAFVFLALLNTSFLGDLDRHLHVNFGGIGFLAYLILWLVMPKRVGLPAAGGPDRRGPGAGRKLFRDTDAGSVGGVAAGLAHYLRLDVTLVRVLFVVLTLAGGGGFLLYVILWVVVPEARTVSDKLEMRGEDVTLSNIDQNLRADAPTGAGRARVVQENLSSIGSSISPIFKFLFTLIVGFAAVMLLIVGLAMLVAFGALLGALLGWFPDSNMQAGDIPVQLLRSTVPGWGVLAGFVAFLIPALGLLGLGIRLFTRRALLNTTARLALFAIWVLSVIGVVTAAAQLHDQFRESTEMVIGQTFDLTTPVVVLKANETPVHAEVRELLLTSADSGQPARLTRRVRARGRDEDAAREAAQGVDYEGTLRDSVLMVPRDFTFKPGTPWREQEVRLTLALPPDHQYRLTEAFAYELEDKALDNRYVHDGLLSQRLFTVRKGRFELVSGPETKLPQEEDNEEAYDEDEDHDDDVDFDLDLDKGIRIRKHLSGDFKIEEPRANAPRRSYSMRDFERIEVSDGYQVRIRRGTEFRVTAQGPQALLDRARVRVSGQTLQIESEGGLRWSWRRHQAEPVLFEIELPVLAGLDLSGAARADVAGFSQGGDLSIEQSGASTLRANLAGSHVKLEASGAARTLLLGSTPKLTADLSGACDLRARKLTATDVSIDASGASSAAITVKHELRADADGASHITYYGQPTDANTNSSGAGSVRNGDRDGGSANDDSDNDDSGGSDDGDDESAALQAPARPQAAAPRLTLPYPARRVAYYAAPKIITL